MSRHPVKILALIPLSLALALGGCATEPGFAGPSVNGSWSGTFRSAPIRLDLSQSGGAFSGTATIVRQVYDISGNVDEQGNLSWSGTDRDPSSCRSLSASRSSVDGAQMDGIVQRRTRSRLASGECNPAGRTLVEQGSVALDRL